MHILVSILWFIFTCLFFYLFSIHHKASNSKLESLEKFNVKRKGGTRVDNFCIGEVLYALRNELNRANQQSHNLAAKSFFIAGLTSLGSLIISIVQVLN